MCEISSQATFGRRGPGVFQVKSGIFLACRHPWIIIYTHNKHILAAETADCVEERTLEFRNLLPVIPGHSVRHSLCKVSHAIDSDAGDGSNREKFGRKDPGL